MKAKELSLMAIGAIAAVILIAAVTSYAYTPVKAQSAAAIQAPGGVSMTVHMANFNNIIQSTQSQAGAIILQDSSNRKVSVVGFVVSFPSSVGTPTPTVQISTTNNSVFVY